MRELALTGFMSNRGRQCVASYLVRDLGLDWRMGAQHFESQLLDHDPCSNYGNWTYAAGIGADPREDRYFNIPKQTKNYDANGDYCRLWCPELANTPLSNIINPRGGNSQHGGKGGGRAGGKGGKGKGGKGGGRNARGGNGGGRNAGGGGGSSGGGGGGEQNAKKTRKAKRAGKGVLQGRGWD
jgi:deoxyribodipyrimidine photo-lyase